MQFVHELGHAVAAWMSGGRVTCIVWHISAISRTEVSPNPFPLLVCWSGPIAGCGIPLLLLLLPQKWTYRQRATLAFFAGFCLIANGSYLAFGSVDRIGDAGVLLKFETPAALLWLVGGVAILMGLGIWHSIGKLADLWNTTITWHQCAVQLAILCTTTVVQQSCFGCG